MSTCHFATVRISIKAILYPVPAPAFIYSTTNYLVMSHTSTKDVLSVRLYTSYRKVLQCIPKNAEMKLFVLQQAS